MKSDSGLSTRTLVSLAMLAALSFLAVALIRVPVVLFLSYEPKDVILTLTALIFGPLAGIGVTVVVSLVEMITISSTGILGFLMNVLASASFLVPPALLYRKRRSLFTAISGLVLGTLLMTGVMLLWNWIITPIYMEADRSYVTSLLLPAFLPFNLIKGGLNAGITLLLYKPIVYGLQRARLLPAGTHAAATRRNTVGILLLGLVTVCTFILPRFRLINRAFASREWGGIRSGRYAAIAPRQASFK